MRKRIGKICMVVGALLILGALALMAYNQWDSNRADKASQEAGESLDEICDAKSAEAELGREDCGGMRCEQERG